jgi:hypothetical protein
MHAAQGWTSLCGAYKPLSISDISVLGIERLLSSSGRLPQGRYSLKRITLPIVLILYYYLKYVIKRKYKNKHRQLLLSGTLYQLWQ